MTALRNVGRRFSLATLFATRAITRLHFMPGWRTSSQDLGYGIEKDGNSFRIAGIDRRHRREILPPHRRHRARGGNGLGSRTLRRNRKLGRRTRERKSESQAVSMEELRKEWDTRLTPEERLAIEDGPKWIREGR